MAGVLGSWIPKDGSAFGGGLRQGVGPPWIGLRSGADDLAVRAPLNLNQPTKHYLILDLISALPALLAQVNGESLVL